MCKPLNEGGQRCAAHTRARLEAAATKMRAAAEGGDPAQFALCRQNWEQAAVEYASTPTGRDALAERAAAAHKDRDVHTEALLTNIIVRGDAAREANENVRAALHAARLTETGLPDDSSDVRVADDQNDNGLSGEEQAQWIALLDTLDERRQDEVADGARSRPGTAGWYNDETGKRVGGNQASRMDTVLADLKDADRVIAAAESTDVELSYALSMLGDAPHQMGPTAQGLPGFSSIHAQSMRALRHPNASDVAFGAALRAGLVSDDEAMSNPKCSDETMFWRVSMSKAKGAGLSESTWNLIAAKTTSTKCNLAVAMAHPNEIAREEAGLRLVGTRWDTVSTSDMCNIAHHIQDTDMTQEQQRVVIESMADWATRYGDERARTLIPQEASGWEYRYAARARQVSAGESPVVEVHGTFARIPIGAEPWEAAAAREPAGTWEPID